MLIRQLSDLATLTDTELSDLYMACISEDERRRAVVNYMRETIPDAPGDGDASLPVDPDATGTDAPLGAAPDEYAQPSGAHDAYPLGALVSFEGYVYQSTLAANVWSPTGYPRGWHKLYPLPQPGDGEPSEPGTPDTGADGEEVLVPSVLPWSPGIDVAPGSQLYDYDGVTYRVVQAHTTQVGWEPPNVPALWMPVP